MKLFTTIKERTPSDHECCWVFDNITEKGQYYEWDPKTSEWYDPFDNRYSPCDDTIYIPSDIELYYGDLMKILKKIVV